MSALVPSSYLSSLLALVPDQVPAINAWRDDLAPIVAQRKGRMAALAALAERRGVPKKTVRKRFDDFVREGVMGLVDKRHASQLWQSETTRGLSEPDQELVKQWCEAFQRKNETAIRALLRAWREQRISDELRQRGLSVPATETPLDPLQGYPRGWSDRNLARYAPSAFELKAARIGRSAAAAHRPLVYTTRANLYVGQFYLFDDIWHDHVVNDLDQRKSGRPLEFHALDLSSACKFGWGNRIRIETETKHEGLKAADFRFLLAAVLAGTGFSPRGTTLVVEHGTAAISADIEQLLADATGGKLVVARSGMEGAAAHAGQYAGRSKGNFRFKASLESLGNLIHNEMAALPGQVGMDRDHCPEEMHDGGRLIDAVTGKPLTRYGALKHNDALLCALSQLPPERAQWLQWDFCTIQQFRLICEEVYGRINRREQHELEGWDERYVPDPRTGKMRRLSPWEYFAPARRRLVPLDADTTALLIGHGDGIERLTRNGMIELRDGELSGDALRFDATALPDREKFLTVLNPFDLSRLFLFDARGRFVAAIERIRTVCRGNTEAVHRACGEAAKREAALLAPLRARHLAEARQKTARHANNARVLGGDPFTPEEKAAVASERSAAEFGQAVKMEMTGERQEKSAGEISETWDDATPAGVAQQPSTPTEEW